MLGTITGVRSEIKEKVFANVSLIRVKLHLSDMVRGQDVSDNNSNSLVVPFFAVIRTIGINFHVTGFCFSSFD